MKNFIARFLFSDRGTTSMEYALIGSLIAVVIVLAVTNLGISVKNRYETVANSYP